MTKLHNNLMAVSAWQTNKEWEEVDDASDNPKDVCWKLKSQMFSVFVFSDKGIFKFEILNADDEVVYEQKLDVMTIEQAKLQGEQLLGEFMHIGGLVFQKRSDPQLLELKHAFTHPLNGTVFGVGENGTLFQYTKDGWRPIRMNIVLD